MSALIEAIAAELDRLDANINGEGLEVEAHELGARFFDTQERTVYEPEAALAALRALSDGAGYDAACQALAVLPERA